MLACVVTLGSMLCICRNHFDVVVACEDENDDDMDVPLVSIKFR